MCHQSKAKTLAQKNAKKKKTKSTPHIQVPLGFGFASDSRRLRPAMGSERMWGIQCSVSGRRSLCYRRRGAEKLLLWLSNGAADWFRQYLDTKHRSSSRSLSTLAMIAQLQLPSFNRSTRSRGARKLTDNFLLVLAACSAASGSSLWPHDPSCRSRLSLVIRSETDVSSSLFRELVLLVVPPDGYCDLQL